MQISKKDNKYYHVAYDNDLASGEPKCECNVHFLKNQEFKMT